MIKYIVIDDEPNPRELLIFSIKSLSLPFQLVGEAKSLLEGVDLIRTVKPDVVFLDIQMPEYNGLRIKSFLNEDELNFKLIFVTAFDQYTIQAIRLSAFDYLLKPIEHFELSECMERIIKEKETENTYHQLKNIENQNVLVIKSHEGTYFINIHKIISITADGMYSKFQLTDKIILSSKPLKVYEQIHEKLFRCHRSHIINLDHVEKLEGQIVVLKDQQNYPVSRNYRADLVYVLKGGSVNKL
jgi:two-component system LytT family response regulator